MKVGPVAAEWLYADGQIDRQMTKVMSLFAILRMRLKCNKITKKQLFAFFSTI